MSGQPAGIAPPDWVARTKLRPPQPRADQIARPALLGALLRALETRQLTLISAPAGYGKTTLLAALAAAAEALVQG